MKWEKSFAVCLSILMIILTPLIYTKILLSILSPLILFLMSRVSLNHLLICLQLLTITQPGHDPIYWMMSVLTTTVFLCQPDNSYCPHLDPIMNSTCLIPFWTPLLCSLNRSSFNEQSYSTPFDEFLINKYTENDVNDDSVNKWFISKIYIFFLRMMKRILVICMIPPKMGNIIHMIPLKMGSTFLPMGSIILIKMGIPTNFKMRGVPQRFQTLWFRY